MKKVVLLMACLLWLQVSGLVSATQLFDLETVREYALSANSEFYLAHLDVEIAKLQRTNAQAEHLRVASVVSVKQAENNLLSAKRRLESTALQIKVEAESRYYNVLSLAQQVELAIQSVDQAEEQLRIINARYNEGLATPMDISRAEQGLFQATNQLTRVEGQSKLARLRLLDVLGLPFETEFAVDDQEFKFETVEFSVERIPELLEINNPDMLQLADQVQVARLDEKTATSEFTAPLIQNLRRLQREKVEVQYAQLANRLYLQALELWNNLQILEASYQSALNEVGIAKENSRVVLLRFNDGLELPSSVMSAQVDLNRANQQAIKALFDYNIAKSQFKNLVGLQ